MDELTIRGKKYISSKRAAQITGYAKDYIGQLARSKKIEATQVGRAWYVLEGALLGHKQENSALISGNSSPVAPYITTPKILYSHRQITDIPKTWSTTRYFDDQGVLIPPLTTKRVREMDEHSSDISEQAQGGSPWLTTKRVREMDEHSSDISEQAQGGSPWLTTKAPRNIHISRNTDNTNENKDRSDSIEKAKTASNIPIVPVPMKMKVGNEIMVGNEIIALKRTTATVDIGKNSSTRPIRVSLARYMPFAIAVIFIIALTIPFSGVFFSSEYLYGPEVNQTATAVAGLENFRDLFEAGIAPIVTLYLTLINSFGTFFQTGLNFILELISRLSEIIFG